MAFSPAGTRKPRFRPSISPIPAAWIPSFAPATFISPRRTSIALALENNIDIETQRYGPLLAREDLRRAQVGGNLRVPSTPIAAGPQSVSLAGINVGSTSLASGAGVGSSGGITAVVRVRYPQPDPFLSISASLGHYTSPESNLIVDRTNYLVEGSRSFSLGYSQQFLPGTAVSASYGASRSNSNSPSNLLNPIDYGSLSVSVSQNLLQGFGSSVNSRYIRIAGNNVKVSDLQLKFQVITTVAAVLNLYWDLVTFNEDLRLKQQALDAARKLYEDSRKEVAIGAKAAIEVDPRPGRDPSPPAGCAAGADQHSATGNRPRKRLEQTRHRRPRCWRIAHIVPLDHIEVPPVLKIFRPPRSWWRRRWPQRADLQQNRLNIASQALVLKGDQKRAEAVSCRPSPRSPITRRPESPIPLNVGYEYGTPDPFLSGRLRHLLGPTFPPQLSRTIPPASPSRFPLRNRAAQADYATDQLQMRQLQLRSKRASTRWRWMCATP